MDQQVLSYLGHLIGTKFNRAGPSKPKIIFPLIESSFPTILHSPLIPAATSSIVRVHSCLPFAKSGHVFSTPLRTFKQRARQLYANAHAEA